MMTEQSQDAPFSKLKVTAKAARKVELKTSQRVQLGQNYLGRRTWGPVVTTNLCSQ